jgi:hypothetical protein
MPAAYGLMHLQLLSVRFQHHAAVLVDRSIIFFPHNRLVRLVMFLLRVEQHKHYHGLNSLVRKDRKEQLESKVLKVQPVLKDRKEL